METVDFVGDGGMIRTLFLSDWPDNLKHAVLEKHGYKYKEHGYRRKGDTFDQQWNTAGLDYNNNIIF